MTTTVPGAPPAPPGSDEPAVTDDPGPFSAERPRAPWLLRALAVLLDSAVVASVAYVATGDAPSFAALPLVGDAADAGGAAWAAGALLALGVLQAYTGMTPGKRVVGISVVDAGTGRPIGLLGTVVRWLAHVLDAILFIGYLRAAVNPQGRTFADSLLGTVAVQTTTPEPHRWMTQLGRARDARAPWLRWPRRVTYAVALVVCAAAAASSLVVGSAGGTREANEPTSCTFSDPSSMVTIDHARSTMWETRLGVRRVTDDTWRVAAAWSPIYDVTGGDGDDARRADLADTTATLTVRSPEGQTYNSAETAADESGLDGIWWSMPSNEPLTAAVAAPEDLEGWTAVASLQDSSGTMVAECTSLIGAFPSVMDGPLFSAP